MNQRLRPLTCLTVVACPIALVAWSLALATEIPLKDGTVLEGSTAPLKSLTAEAKAASPGDPIVVINEYLRRYYVPRLQILEPRAGRAEPLQKFVIPQPGKIDAGKPVISVGQALHIDKWDDFGRRTFKMATARGPANVIQCITEITAKYAQVEAYKDYQWKLRIATTSIPPDTLHRLIMKRAIDPRRLSDRRSVVLFYLQLERFNVAEAELEALIKDFPEAAGDLKPLLRSIKQLASRRVLDEIKARRAAGQHRLAYTLLKNFPTKDVAGEILEEVSQELKDYDSQLKQHQDVIKQLDGHVRALIAKEAKYKVELETIGKEIAAELSIHTLDRMAAYQQAASDPAATLEQKVALAISGWSQGPKGATNNLPVALSLYKVRALVHEYFNTEIKLDREEILRKLKSQEGATAERLANMLAHMKPPKDTLEPTVDAKKPRYGYFELTVDGLPGGAPTTYYVQLPPEYNPYRRYPAIVTLHGAGTTAPMQVDWWAGGVDDRGERRGQATRHGYIVIAPAWGEPHQARYEFSLREHVAVLNALRDACRRFSIDTDRVFLSGHSMGGTAAWDIALAHPDLFAGLIPIACKCEKYIDLYWENASYLPIYYVCGELDGDKFASSGVSLDRYMKAAPPVNVIVAEFVGRGHEDFSDELLNLFPWMSRHRRDYDRLRQRPGVEFTCSTKRPWDNFFWWVEWEGMPEKLMVLPEDWGKKKGGGAYRVNSRIATGTGGGSSIFVTGGASRITLWLSPEVVNFTKPITMLVNGSRRTTKLEELRPSIDVILEDVRTRGDRLHPFWAKFVFKDARAGGL
jgi:pimeloyl-ACP methyl ester carboxylesterase